jgi:8-oxo-dGTP pyrophosphatase MutT (NUDIX family)
MCKDIVDELRAYFNNSLPGIEAQKKMAPQHRNIVFNNSDNSPAKEAAVAIILYPKNNKLCTVFIKRPEYDGPHSAQISFPGGKFEENDSDLIQTAVRETKEEIGICADDLTIISTLSNLYIPVSNIKVLPVLCFLPYTPEFNIDKSEVEHIIEVDINKIFSANSRKNKTITINNKAINAPYYDLYNNHVWGATAMIISELTEVLNGFDFNQVLPDFCNAQNDQ